MKLNPNKIKLALSGLCGGFIFTAVLASAHTVQPAKEQTQIASSNYQVIAKDCEETCLAVVQADEAQIFVQYEISNQSIDVLSILKVEEKGIEINAYVDRYEIEKINAVLGSK